MDMTSFSTADATSIQNRYQAADFDKLTNHRTFTISTTPDSNVARTLPAEHTSNRLPVATADKRSISSRRASSSTAQGSPSRVIRRDSSYSSVHENGEGKMLF